MENNTLPSTVSEIKTLVLAYYRQQLPVFVTGQPGIGKSDLFEQIANDLGATYKRFEMATYDAVDVKGCPFPVDGATEFLPPKDFLELTDRAEYQGPMVVNFDDLPAAEESVFNSLLGIILTRHVGEYPIRKNVLLCATGNRAEDKAGAREITTALSNRFTHFHMESDDKEWCNWAIKNDIDPNIIGYIRSRPDQLNQFDPKTGQRAFATPRSVAKASLIQQAIGLDHKLFVLAIASAVGYGWAGEYKAWLDRTRTLVTPEEILKDPRNCRVPDDEEVDVLHATMASLVHAIGQTPTFQNLKSGFIYCSRIPRADMAAVLAADLNVFYQETKDTEVSDKMWSDPDFTSVYKNFLELIS